MRRILCVIAIFLGSVVLCAESSAQKTKDPSAAKHDDAQLRLSVRNNVMQHFKKLEQPERIEQAAEKFFEKERWDQELKSFQNFRASEIHGSGHEIIKSTLPGIMQKSMPKFMQARIMAERKAKKAKGPPSAKEIERIRAETMAKMKPVMENTVMAGLRKLTDERMEEASTNEKLLTRAMSEQILKVVILPKPLVAKFRTELDKAGYPESLIRGTDPVLNERVQKMLKTIDLAAAAKEAGL